MTYGRGFEGAAYKATERLDVTEIAKRVRVNLRNAQELGALPEAMTWTVQIRKFAGGCAIDVRLSGMPDTWTYNTPGLEADYCARVPQHGGYTTAAKAAHAYASEVLQSYNRDDSDVQTDYFDVKFYGGVEIHDEASQWWAAQEAHVREAQRKAAAARKAAGVPTRGRDAQYAAARVARDARAEYQAANPRPYSG